MYKTILVPHAGTPGGDEALKHAIFIAKASNAKIIILHIVEEFQYPPTFALSSSERSKLFKSVREANEEIKNIMTNKMEELQKECKDSNVKACSEVSIGEADKEILRIMKEKNVDLIIMAKRRKLKGVKRILSLGSVSRKIVEETTCPVMLIDMEKK